VCTLGGVHRWAWHARCSCRVMNVKRCATCLVIADIHFWRFDPEPRGFAQRGDGCNEEERRRMLVDWSVWCYVFSLHALLDRGEGSFIIRALFWLRC
jgi:hypothetical protein